MLDSTIKLWSLKEQETFDVPIIYREVGLRFSTDGFELLEFNLKESYLRKHLVDFRYLFYKAKEIINRDLTLEERTKFKIEQ